MDEPWFAPLAAGHSDAAWDLFVDQYRRLIFASIRHYLQDYDDVMDVFVYVCEALREDDLRRLRAYASEPVHRARFSTWLVTVVRNLTVDWLRRRDGRRRMPALAEGLPPLQQTIFRHVFLDVRSHTEAYELIRSRESPALTFRDFLVELRSVYRVVTAERRGALLPGLVHLPIPETESGESNQDGAGERRAVLERALCSLAPQDRVVVELYVMEGMAAEEVARLAQLPNAKAVYNRAYRALAALREWIAAAGLGEDDL